MRAPGADSGFDVGDTVEVFCDHEKDGERIRGWVKGVVVQVDNKLVAVVPFNVFLTDGWMVPDRILWYSSADRSKRGQEACRQRSQLAALKARMTLDIRAFDDFPILGREAPRRKLVCAGSAWRPQKPQAVIEL
jgi:hypothetical protein